MSDAINPVLIGLISTLVTLILTPRLQHYFWSYQRMSELRLVVFREVNALAAGFLNSYMDDPSFHPSAEFFRRLTVATADINVLFSQRAFASFKDLEVMIGPNLGPSGKGSIEAFIEKRNRALRTLYEEVVQPRLFSGG